jgi:CheY-like chemotaxis protein
MLQNQKIKILTVDDDEDVRETLSSMLEAEGFRTVRARNGLVAIDYLNSIPDAELPDLVMLDYMMPVMNGEAFCRAKSTIPRIASIPVVMMTASGNLIKVMGEVEKEACGFISKPMDVDTLIDLLERVLQPKKDMH